MYLYKCKNIMMHLLYIRNAAAHTWCGWICGITVKDKRHRLAGSSQCYSDIFLLHNPLIKITHYSEMNVRNALSRCILIHGPLRNLKHAHMETQ